MGEPEDDATPFIHPSRTHPKTISLPSFELRQRYASAPTDHCPQHCRQRNSPRPQRNSLKTKLPPFILFKSRRRYNRINQRRGAFPFKRILLLHAAQCVGWTKPKRVGWKFYKNGVCIYAHRWMPKQWTCNMQKKNLKRYLSLCYYGVPNDHFVGIFKINL